MHDCMIRRLTVVSRRPRTGKAERKMAKEESHAEVLELKFSTVFLPLVLSGPARAVCASNLPRSILFPVCARRPQSVANTSHPLRNDIIRDRLRPLYHLTTRKGEETGLWPRRRPCLSRASPTRASCRSHCKGSGNPVERPVLPSADARRRGPLEAVVQGMPRLGAGGFMDRPPCRTEPLLP